LKDCTTAPLLTYLFEIVIKSWGAVGGAVVVQLGAVVVQLSAYFQNCTLLLTRMDTEFTT